MKDKVVTAIEENPKLFDGWSLDSSTKQVDEAWAQYHLYIRTKEEVDLISGTLEQDKCRLILNLNNS